MPPSSQPHLTTCWGHTRGRLLTLLDAADGVFQLSRGGAPQPRQAHPVQGTLHRAGQQFDLQSTPGGRGAIGFSAASMARLPQFPGTFGRKKRGTTEFPTSHMLGCPPPPPGPFNAVSLSHPLFWLGGHKKQVFFVKQGKTIKTEQQATGNLKLGLRLDIVDESRGRFCNDPPPSIRPIVPTMNTSASTQCDDGAAHKHRDDIGAIPTNTREWYLTHALQTSPDLLVMTHTPHPQAHRLARMVSDERSARHAHSPGPAAEAGSPQQQRVASPAEQRAASPAQQRAAVSPQQEHQRAAASPSPRGAEEERARREEETERRRMEEMRAAEEARAEAEEARRRADAARRLADSQTTPQSTPSRPADVSTMGSSRTR